MQITPELLAAVFGGGISLAVKLVPALDDWFINTLNKNLRGPLMLGLSVLVPASLFGLTCARVYDFGACQTEQLPTLVNTWISFVIANQGLFLMTNNSPARDKEITEGKSLVKAQTVAKARESRK
jgi:hypothetical protein